MYRPRSLPRPLLRWPLVIDVVVSEFQGASIPRNTFCKGIRPTVSLNPSVTRFLKDPEIWNTRHQPRRDRLPLTEPVHRQLFRTTSSTRPTHSWIAHRSRLPSSLSRLRTTWMSTTPLAQPSLPLCATASLRPPSRTGKLRLSSPPRSQKRLSPHLTRFAVAFRARLVTGTSPLSLLSRHKSRTQQKRTSQVCQPYNFIGDFNQPTHATPGAINSNPHLSHPHLVCNCAYVR